MLNSKTRQTIQSRLQVLAASLTSRGIGLGCAVRVVHQCRHKAMSYCFLSVVLSSVMEMCDKFTAVDENATKNITAIQLNSRITVSRTLTLLEGTLEIAVAAFKIKLLST